MPFGGQSSTTVENLAFPKSWNFTNPRKIGFDTFPRRAALQHPELKLKVGFGPVASVEQAAGEPCFAAPWPDVSEAQKAPLAKSTDLATWRATHVAGELGRADLRGRAAASQSALA